MAFGLLLLVVAVGSLGGTWRTSRARNSIGTRIELPPGVDTFVDLSVDQPGAYEITVYPAGGIASMPEVDYEVLGVTPPLASRLTAHDAEFARTSDGRGARLGWFAPGPHREMAPWSGHSLRLRNASATETLSARVEISLIGAATHRPAIAGFLLPFIAVLAMALAAAAAFLLRTRTTRSPGVGFRRHP